MRTPNKAKIIALKNLSIAEITKDLRFDNPIIRDSEEIKNLLLKCISYHLYNSEDTYMENAGCVMQACRLIGKKEESATLFFNEFENILEQLSSPSKKMQKVDLKSFIS
jgi:hypothetical protein